MNITEPKQRALREIQLGTKIATVMSNEITERDRTVTVGEVRKKINPNQYLQAKKTYYAQLDSRKPVYSLSPGVNQKTTQRIKSRLNREKDDVE